MGGSGVCVNVCESVLFVLLFRSYRNAGQQNVDNGIKQSICIFHLALSIEMVVSPNRAQFLFVCPRLRIRAWGCQLVDGCVSTIFAKVTCKTLLISGLNLAVQVARLPSRAGFALTFFFQLAWWTWSRVCRTLWTFTSGRTCLFVRHW